MGYPEFLGERPRALDDRIGDGRQLAARVAFVAGDVRELGPRASAKNADAHATTRRLPVCGCHCITALVSPGSISWRCAQIGAMPFVMNRSWNSRNENFAPMRF